MTKKWQPFILLILLILLGCSQQPAPDNGEEGQIANNLEQLAPIRVPATFTPLSQAERQMTAVPQITVTQNPLPNQATNTPIPFGDTAVELRYTIPSIGLDRRLQGNISSQIILADEATGQLIKRDNQAGTLVELQQSLPNLLLGPIPEGCEACVLVSYDLPFADQKGEGWLKDRVMLASIENYFAISFGPHFPPNTVIGLRRTASPFAPAHTIAITEDGMQYVWFATESELETAVPADPALLEALNQLDLAQLASQYQVTCPGTPLEALLLKSGETSKQIDINCPEYTLPTTLIPLYTGLDVVLTDKIAASDVTQERPPVQFSLDTLLDYKRVDGAQLTLFQDGTAVAISPSNQTITTTLTSTDVLSLTTTLLESNTLKLGLTSFLGDGTATGESTGTATAVSRRSVLLLRGPGGVYDGFWNGNANVPVLEPLNELLNTILGDLLTTPLLEETAVSEATATPEP